MEVLYLATLLPTLAMYGGQGQQMGCLHCLPYPPHERERAFSYVGICTSFENVNGNIDSTEYTITSSIVGVCVWGRIKAIFNIH